MLANSETENTRDTCAHLCFYCRSSALARGNYSRNDACMTYVRMCRHAPEMSICHTWEFASCASSVAAAHLRLPCPTAPVIHSQLSLW